MDFKDKYQYNFNKVTVKKNKEDIDKINKRIKEQGYKQYAVINRLLDFYMYFTDKGYTFEEIEDMIDDK